MSLARIVFHVQDAQARPIGGALLSAVSTPGPWQGVTDAAGDFVANLTPAHYDITIAALGYVTRTLPADLADPGTVTIGLERAGADLEARGRWFYWKGTRTPLVGTDGFMDYRLYLDGGAAALVPHFAESNELGFRVRRVFLQGSIAQNQVMDLRPTEPNYYPNLRPFVQTFNANGLVPLLTIGVDNQDVLSPISHWNRVVSETHGTTRLISFFNEWSKNKSDFDPGAIPAPSDVLWSRGSDQQNGAPFKPVGSFMEFHPVRNMPTAIRDTVASPTELYDVQSYPNIPLVIDEPPKFGMNGSSAEYADPELAYRFFRHYTAECAGVIFHNWFGQRGLLMDDLTRQCAVAAVRGARL